jgi:endonuclease-3
MTKKKIKSKSIGRSTSVALKIIDRLSTIYHDAHCALHHSSPFQLLIATILSAQCTDERVNQVTPKLFKEYPTPEKMACADLSRIEKLIYSTGFYKNKAKNIISCSKEIVKKHKSEVPRDLEKLVHLPGVGRKTANVVLGNAFNIPSGIVVDTHVLRLSQRFGWINTQNAEITERELLKFVPPIHWIAFSHWMIFHGRQVCTARSPKCDLCFLKDLCPQVGV